MSMPELIKAENVLTREQAINAILTSIAMEETALSNIIDVEGEKVQYAIQNVTNNNDSAAMQKLLEINRSASCMLDQVSDIQIILKNKMRYTTGYMPPIGRIYLPPGDSPPDDPPVCTPPKVVIRSCVCPCKKAYLRKNCNCNIIVSDDNENNCPCQKC